MSSAIPGDVQQVDLVVSARADLGRLSAAFGRGASLDGGDIPLAAFTETFSLGQRLNPWGRGVKTACTVIQCQQICNISSYLTRQFLKALYVCYGNILHTILMCSLIPIAIAGKRVPGREQSPSTCQARPACQVYEAGKEANTSHSSKRNW